MDVYQHFSLAANPFSTTPDPAFAYETKEHRLAMVKILYSIQERMGIFLLQGEVGTGKTTLSRFLIQTLEEDDNYLVSYLSSLTMRTSAGMLRTITTSFGLPSRYKERDISDELLGFLVQAHKDGKTVVLMVDEAQTIHGPNLTTLHMLSNHQTLKHKLLQIVLFSQPTFTRKLEQVPALRSRITGAAYLNPLSFEDAVEMLRFRMEKAGGSFDTVFPSRELHHMLYQAAGGIPRELCVLANAAMVNAYGMNNSRVCPEDIEAAVADFRFKFKEATRG
jgi:type II secretory pathway predicted ATPase ExeA